MKTKISAHSICLCSLFTSLIVIGAYIKIPMPAVPFTLQTFFVMLAGMVLGKRNAVICCTLYLVLGLIGLPVFTLGGGLSYIFNPTLGYIIGFIPGVYIIGSISQNAKSFTKFYIAAVTGLIVIYLFGTAYYFFITTVYMKASTALAILFSTCILTTLPIDLVLALFSVVTAKRIIKK